MPLNIIRGDLSKIQAEALVNPANSQLMGGGGVSGALFRAAGWEKMQAACDAIGHCAPGQAVVTPAFALPARYVIHTVGPVYQGGRPREARLLWQAYVNSLNLAKKMKLGSIAFPLISSGTYGYPQAEALDIAIRSIRGWLDDQKEEPKVTLVLFHRLHLPEESLLLRRIAQQVAQSKHLAEHIRYSERDHAQAALEAAVEGGEEAPQRLRDYSRYYHEAPMPQAKDHRTLGERILELDEGFSTTLLRLIDERGMTDTQVYKRANIDRKHFSKIRSNPHYAPTKATVLQLAIALGLNHQEASDLLARAGFAFSPAHKMDVVIGYCLKEGIHNIDRINTLLLQFDLATLGV